MLANGSQSEGDTQPISPSIYEQYNSRSKGERTARSSRLSQSYLEGQEDFPHTLQQGEPGHIDLLAAFEPPSLSEDEDPPVGVAEEDDIDPLSQPQDVRADISPETRRFQPPKTPASQGRKRKRENELSSQGQPTPKLPINPFAGHISMDGVMSASQLFRATQAATSPLANIIASDGLSERPSPDMHDFQRPSTAGIMSSPVHLPRSNMVRAVTEPQTIYISMKESQEARERLLQARKAERALDADELSDDDFDNDSELRRRLRHKQYSLEARNQFAAVAASSQSTLRRRDRGRGGRGKENGRSSPRRPGTQASEPVLISDDTPAEGCQGSITEDETEREEDVEAADEDEIDELAEDNKENIEVPATISRARLGGSQVHSSQPSPSRKQMLRAKVAASPTKKTVQVFGSSQISRSQDVPKPDENGTQTEAIADSQSSQAHAKVKSRVQGPGTRAFSEPRSSLDSRVFVPQSQISEGSSGIRQTMTMDRVQRNARDPPHSPHQYSRTAREAEIRSEDPIVQVDIPNAGAVREQPQLEAASGKALSGEDTNARTAEHSASNNLIHENTSLSSYNGGDYLERTQQRVSPPSTMMPSPRTTPKSTTKAASSHSIAHGTRASTTFETAPERPANSSSNLSPLRRLQRSQSTRPSPEKSRLIRTMSEIAADPSPPDIIGEVDVDMNILSSEDREFQKTLHGSSPVAPSRKRRRGGLGIALKDGDFAPGMLPKLPGSPLPPPSSAVSAITPVQVTASKSIPVSSSPPAHILSAAGTEGNNTCEKQPHSQPETDHESGHREAVVAENFQVASRAGNSVPAPRAQVPIDGRVDPPAPAITSDAGSSREVVREPSVIAPNRVLAHFNGGVAAYHPATCLEVINGEEPRYRVRFDDGTVDTISAYGIKRLELRVGDIIKVDLPGSRTKNYCVDGMRDPQRPTTPADPDTPSRRGRKHLTNDPAFPETDIYGFATVLASPKQRSGADGNEANTSQIAIPITQIYITQTLWTSYKNRQYTHVSKRLHTSTGLQTPSERPSTPSTPSSRARRIKGSGFAQSRSAITSILSNEGMFKNMAFAITNVDRTEDSKRVKDHILSNGGIILDNGFDELFSIPSLNRTTDPVHSSASSLHLTSQAQEIGFACLIADKHCRRAKFVQALALGIPCLATRWISDCIAKQRVLPWAPYLLPAGESAFLGGAVRSRNLESFPADAANLPDMVDNRPKLLEGASVLLIMEKGQEDTMKQHPLITHALGASKVTRAISQDAAAKAVADAQALGDPWDWVFSYDKEKEVEKRLSGGSCTGKKRKRGKESEYPKAPEKKTKTKVVSNEYVIQSLILGMLIDE